MAELTVRERVEALPVGAHFMLGHIEWIRTPDGGRHATDHGWTASLRDAGTFTGWEPHQYREVSRPDGPAAGAVTHERYDPSMLPMFAALAKEADSRGYCGEYDALAAIVGAPSRTEIRALTAEKYRVTIPMIFNVTIDVHADSPEDAIARADKDYTWRDVAKEQIAEGLRPSEWPNTSTPRKELVLELTAEKIDS